MSTTNRNPTVTTLDDFFGDWCHRYNVTATVEGAMKFQEARAAWSSAKQQHSVLMGALHFTNDQLVIVKSSERYHKAKANEWLSAYQKVRVKNIGDYTRIFLRRPRLRRIVLFLMRFD